MKIPKIIMLWGAMLLIGSCVKDISPKTNHENITFTIDWSALGADIAIPGAYTVQVGELTATLSGQTSKLPNRLATGDYRMYVFNAADKITVNGTTAYADAVSENVDPMPGWLMTAAMDISVTKNKALDVTAVMTQQVRGLSIALTVSEGDPARIRSIKGALTGIAEAWNFDTDTPVGNGKVQPAFTLDGDQITTTMRLLGIMPTAEQKLTITVTFSDNSTQTIVCDLSSLLTDFNTKKHIPVTLTADVQIPIGTGLAFTVDNWTMMTERPGTAN